MAWNLKRLLKPGGVIVWVVNDKTDNGSETGTSMRQALHFQSIGLCIHDTMVWHKVGIRFPESVRCHPAFEYMFVVSKGKPSVFNQIKDRRNKSAGERTPSTPEPNADGSWRTPKRFRVTQQFGARTNVWQIHEREYDGRRRHPAAFPEALARDHILSWSNHGDVVLDPFSGSGTTAKMARETGRRFIGIEVNPEYVEISRKRLAQQALPMDVA
ncbi:MAG: site-specific DNA-methyltransferase [Caulobacteraceae bacterium]|nr:site-specific DNA-methyltransferase [Caulobacteraceae bacterium]